MWSCTCRPQKPGFLCLPGSATDPVRSFVSPLADKRPRRLTQRRDPPKALDTQQGWPTVSQTVSNKERKLTGNVVAPLLDKPPGRERLKIRVEAAPSAHCPPWARHHVPGASQQGARVPKATSRHSGLERDLVPSG